MKNYEKTIAKNRTKKKNRLALNVEVKTTSK